MPAPRANLTSWWSVSVLHAGLNVAPVFTVGLDHSKATESSLVIPVSIVGPMKLQASGGSASTVTPQFVANANKVGSIQASLTVTPMFGGFTGAVGSSGVTVTPTFSASAMVVKYDKPKQINVAVMRSTTK